MASTSDAQLQIKLVTKQSTWVKRSAFNHGLEIALCLQICGAWYSIRSSLRYLVLRIEHAHKWAFERFASQKITGWIASVILSEFAESTGSGTLTEFDFLVSGELLRAPLSEHLLERNVSVEEVVLVEYVERFPAPEPQDCLEHDDWVSATQSGGEWLVSALRIVAFYWSVEKPSIHFATLTMIFTSAGFCLEVTTAPFICGAKRELIFSPFLDTLAQ